MTDNHWMKRVLRLAAKGRGRTSPNPMVGAVLVKHEKAVGEGYHARAGEDHAEIVAMKKAGAEVTGSTLYLNLEPCTHTGRTPPCAPAVIASGVNRVVIGMVDPNPLVQGSGVRRLKEAGLEVVVGVLEQECRQLNEAFCKYIVEKKPFVILKAAATLDGKIATREGDSKWISSEPSRRLVHRLRDQVDGIIVGIGTILKDDPLLTVRMKRGRDPFRIILDSHLRVPEEARVIGESPSKTIVVTTEMAPGEKVERLQKRGVKVLVLDSREGRVDLKSCLLKLGEMGMLSVLVEGGGQVNGSFLDHRLIDKLVLFLSPRLMGDRQATGVFEGKGVKTIKETIPLERLKVRRTGEDLLLEGYVKPVVSASRGE